MRRYVADTNVFITGWRYYPLRLFADLWSVLDELAHEGSFFTTEVVLDELAEKNDEIHQWVKARKNHLVRPLTEDTQRIVREILVRNTSFVRPQRTKQWADPFVIAEAKASAGVVVTYENPRSPERMPAVCQKEGVLCIDMIDFFVDAGIRFSVSRTVL